ncbi:phage integrase SAM-like domain-containing protein [Chryseobacterium sp.]|uniref:phage integrase SAM-like domain-containing protein n=1 Tax=Chryseobacterium sp. TaxID=1871047 RepID=UPI0031E21DD8
MTFQFYLSHTENELKSINLKIFYGKHKINIETSLKIYSKEWDFEKGRPKNIYKKHYKQLDSRLSHLKIQLAEYIENKVNKGQNISHSLIKRKADIICKKKNSIKQGSLLRLIQEYIDLKKDQVCYSTYKRYNVFKNLIERIEGFKNKTYSINISPSCLVKDIIAFGEVEMYSKNTIYRTLSFIKTILNYAESKGIKTNARSFVVKKQKFVKKAVSLTKQDLIKIQNTVVPEELQPSKDWLLISCYTGQRISDFMSFTSEKIKKN